ncbi:MAG: radical SAM protein [Candidatus Falkowbacteria bacterium]
MKPVLKIALLDLSHTTCGAHANVVPYGIGLMAVYLKKNLGDRVEIKLFKEVKIALAAFKFWIPGIVGISQYLWNSELNLYVASLIKQANPECLVVAGGANIELEAERREIYLKKNNFVDIGVAFDGEIPLLELTKRLLKGETVADLKKNLTAGTFSLNSINSEYHESSEPAPRIDSLDVFGPIYKSHIFDEFLEAGFQPFTQTHRGCPFSCAYCNTSNSYHSKMLFLSPEIFKEDMEYLGKRFAGKPEVMFYMANTNMSLFKEDFSIAHIIRETQDKYNWPKYVFFATGKKPKKLLDMLSIIKFVPTPALQTLTPAVLANINRINLPLEDYIKLQREILLRTGKSSMTELIICLPGETKRTFLATIKKVINSGVQNIVIYTLMKLPGSLIAGEEFSKKYKYDLRYRIVPREYTVVNGKKIIETDEVIIGTKDMSFKDYLEIRDLCFTISAFLNSAELKPLRRFLLEYKLEIAKWIFNINKNLKNFSDIFKYYQDYRRETKEELFMSREELFKYFNKEENFNKLLTGARGDNLLRKYKCLVLSNIYSSLLELAILEARKLIRPKVARREADKMNKMIDNLAVYLAARDLKSILKNDRINDKVNKISLNYNIPAWLSNQDSSLKLENFKGAYNYLVGFSQAQRKNLLNLNTHKDFTLSLQVFYRDGLSSDYWPSWTLI